MSKYNCMYLYISVYVHRCIYTCMYIYSIHTYTASYFPRIKPLECCKWLFSDPENVSPRPLTYLILQLLTSNM